MESKNGEEKAREIVQRLSNHILKYQIDHISNESSGFFNGRIMRDFSPDPVVKNVKIVGKITLGLCTTRDIKNE